MLIIEALSKALRVADICLEAVDIPDIDDAPDLRPLKWSLDRELEAGLLSGNSAFTIANRSAGPRTKYGWTSTVSLNDVIERAGRSFALDLDDRVGRNREMMPSIRSFIIGGVEGVGSQEKFSGLHYKKAIQHTIIYPLPTFELSLRLP